MFFAIIMGRKTPYGEKITAQVLGFKEFLEKVEKPQLEQMGESNPNYFYEILPYAYVLNVSKKWIEKFENIPVPENYMGNFEYSDIDSYMTQYIILHQALLVEGDAHHVVEDVHHVVEDAHHVEVEDLGKRICNAMAFK